MPPKKSKRDKKDAARKEKIAAKKKEARETKAPIERDDKKKPPRDHWLQPESYINIPAVYCLGIPSGNELQPVGHIIELLVKERGAMIVSDNNTDETFNKQLHEALEEAQEKATSGIARQFRKASVHVHPDRHGDMYWKEFDRLKSAYAIMKDPEVRKDYLDTMLHHHLLYQLDPRIRVTVPNYHQTMHDDWQEKFKKKQEQDTAHARYQQQQQDARTKNDFRRGAGPQQHYYLDASERAKQPGHSSIYKRSALNRTIVLGLHFRNSEDLFHFLHEVVIVAWPINDEENQTEVKRLSREDLESVLHKKEDDEGSHRVFRVPLEFDEHCKWCIQWYVILNIPDLDDPYSITSSTRRLVFDLHHPAWKRSKHEYTILLQLAKADASALSNFCRKLVAQESKNPQVLEEESWKLHRLLSKGRSTGRRLHTCLEILEYSVENCEPLELLLKACEEAVHAKSVLDQHVFAGQKRNALKSFKQSVATMIESGELSDWLDQVKMEQLKNHGGEANRLFQLLVEGKKANSLLVDSSALRKAANRSDLFSEKQCKTLLDRAVQADEQLAIETDRLVKEEQERKKEEAQLARLEARAKGMPPRGSEVELFGLQKRDDMNGSVGWYMGIATTTEDRYIVKLFDGSEVALKKTNFRPHERLNEVGFASAATPIPAQPNPPQSSASKPTPSTPNRNKKSAAASQPSPTKTKAPPNTTSQEESSEAITPPHRKQATWILKHQVASFIGKRGAHIKELSAKTKVSHIRVVENEVYMTTDGRKWVLVKLSGKIQHILNAIKVIDQWVEGGDSNYEGMSVAKQTKQASKSITPMEVKTEVSSTQILQEESSRPKQSATDDYKASPRNIAPSPTSTMEPVEESSPEYPVAAGNSNSVLQKDYHGNAHHIPTPAGTSPIGPPSAAKGIMPVSPANNGSSLQIGQRVSKENSATSIPGLMEFLTEQVGSFKVSASVFFEYLKYMDVEHMTDLAEAVEDDHVMSDFIENGLKKFKKGSFKKSVLAVATSKEFTSSMMAPSSIPGLIEFLTGHGASFKTSPKAFFDYVTSMDIESMRDLAEAVEDDDVIADFIENGLKKFKKDSFKKAVLAIETLKSSLIPDSNHAPSTIALTPDGLTCPISFQLMTNDPVLAADGMTYERAVIQEWFQRNQGSECILSPITAEPLQNLHLQPNIAVRTMAREYERSTQVG